MSSSASGESSSRPSTTPSKSGWLMVDRPSRSRTSPVSLLLCLVPSTLLCFANGKILTPAGGPTAARNGSVDEDSRIPSQSHPRALRRDNAARGGGLHQGVGPRGFAPAEFQLGGCEVADLRRGPRQRRGRQTGALSRRGRGDLFAH